MYVLERDRKSKPPTAGISIRFDPIRPLNVPTSAVELAPLDVDPILLHGHAQVLHRQDRPALARSTLSTTTKSTPLHAQLHRLLSLARTARAAGTNARRTSRAARTGASTQGIVRRSRVGRPDSTVLIGIGGDVGDELLRRECQEARERQRGGVCAGTGWVGGRWRREAR